MNTNHTDSHTSSWRQVLSRLFSAAGRTIACLLLFVPAQAAVIYTLSANYAPTGLAAGTTVDWQFQVPAVITTPTTVTTFTSRSTGGDLSGCTINDVRILAPTVSPFTSSLITDFTSACGLSNTFTGASANFFESITSPGLYSAYSRQTNNPLIGTLIIGTPEPATWTLLGIALLGIFCRTGVHRIARVVSGCNWP